ncbi:MAG: hypothetical protein ACLTYN_16225 [Dysosmobacter welbionis]
MSASREKKLRQDQTASGYVDPKAEKELEEKKAEKRSNVLYSVIAVLFVLVVAASFLWRSNVISRNATALTIDGEKYSAAEVNFYYQNVYRGFLQSNSYFISYLGLDTNASLKSQTVNATAASMMGVEEGSSWHDYIMDNTVKQMTMVQRGLEAGTGRGLSVPASVQEQYEDSLNSLKTSAESTGMSVKAYLQRNLGAIMTEKVYNQQVLRMLQYQAYAQSYSDSLTYTDAELEAAYQADPKAYDKAAWEYVVVSGAADSTTDADGNTVQATDEEQAAAKEAAKATAEEILAAYNSGKSLESIAGNYERLPITTPPTPLIMTALWVTGSLTMPARTVTRRFWKLEPTIMSVCSTAAAARNTRPWTSVTSSSPPKPAPRLRATRAMRTSRPSEGRRPHQGRGNSGPVEVRRGHRGFLRPAGYGKLRRRLRV